MKFKVGDKVRIVHSNGAPLSDGDFQVIGHINVDELNCPYQTTDGWFFGDEHIELCEPRADPTAKKDNIKDCKPPIKYIHPDFIEGIAFGMLAGEIKYEAWNFILGHDMQDLLDGAVRHINLMRKGEAVDADTTKRLRDKFGDKAPEVLHIWLAACNLNMIMWQLKHDTLRNSWPTSASK